MGKVSAGGGDAGELPGRERRSSDRDDFAFHFTRKLDHSRVSAARGRLRTRVTVIFRPHNSKDVKGEVPDRGPQSFSAIGP